MTNHVGDLTILRMREARSYSILSRDCLLGDIGQDLDLRLYAHMNPHPVSYMDVAADWLGRDTRFRKTLVRAHDLKGRPRALRCFTLREEFRDPTP